MFQFMRRYQLVPVFSIEEFKHWFMPRPGIVNSYVVEVRVVLFTAIRLTVVHCMYFVFQ